MLPATYQRSVRRPDQRLRRTGRSGRKVRPAGIALPRLLRFAPAAGGDASPAALTSALGLRLRMLGLYGGEFLRADPSVAIEINRLEGRGIAQTADRQALL